MKKNFIFLTVVIMALLAALLLKQCAKIRVEQGKKKEPVVPEAGKIVPGGSIRKALNEEAAPGKKDYDIFLIRTDAFGNVKWRKAYGTEGYDWADFAIQSEDGGFLVLGRTYPGEKSRDDYYMMKVDAEGGRLWARNISENSINTADPLAQAVDGGYIIAGKTFSEDSPEKEIFLARTDKEGNYEWVHNYGREYYDWGYSSVITADGSSIIIGQEEDSGDMSDVTLSKRNNDGNYAWEKTYGGKGYDRGYSIVPLGPYYMLAGVSFLSGSDSDDVYLVKVDENGESIWDKTYGGSGYDEAFSICAAGNNSVAVAGTTSSWGKGGYDIFIMKTDAEGNSLWSRVYGGAGNEAAYSINVLKDGGFIIAGTTNSLWDK